MNRTHEPGTSTGVANKSRGLISGSCEKLFVHRVGLTYSEFEARRWGLDLYEK